MSAKMNCWEFKRCGRNETLDCPVVRKKAGKFCWLVAGTLCGGKPQGIFIEKVGTCLNCDFYRYVNDQAARPPLAS